MHYCIKWEWMCCQSMCKKVYVCMHEGVNVCVLYMCTKVREGWIKLVCPQIDSQDANAF